MPNRSPGDHVLGALSRLSGLYARYIYIYISAV